MQIFINKTLFCIAFTESNSNEIDLILKLVFLWPQKTDSVDSEEPD